MVPPASGSKRAAVLAAVDTWWKGHDGDDAALLEKVLAPGARSWFVHGGALQFVAFGKEIERITSGNRRPPIRPLPGQKRTVVDFKQERGVATVTMLIEIPRAGTTSRSYTTFQLYKADDLWQIVTLAGMWRHRIRLSSIGPRSVLRNPYGARSRLLIWAESPLHGEPGGAQRRQSRARREQP